MPEMTPKQRVLTSLAHREPDRVPVDFGGRSTTIHAFVERDLKRYLGLEGGEEKIVDYHTYLVEPDPRLIERFGRDTLPFRQKANSKWQMRIDPQTNIFADEWGTTFYMPPDGYYFDILSAPLANAQTVEDLEDYQWPDPTDPGRMEGVADEVKAASAKGEHAIMMCATAFAPWTKAWYLRGLEQAYMDLVCNRELAEAVAEKLTEWTIANWDTVLSQVGNDINLVWLEGDLGGQNGPLFSPAVFRKMYKPRLARIVATIKAQTSAKVFLHSCGSVYWVIPDLIEVGIDVLNPVQVTAADMDPVRLKREFGKDLTFWGGGCDPVVLQNGTPQQVSEEVKRRIDALAPGGGYVFGSIHNIQPGVPPQNVVAMFETAREYGVYSG